VHSPREMLMVRQFRPARDAETLEFPAGGIEAGESPEDAARRELLEETGCTAKEWIPLGQSGLGNHRETNSCFLFAAFGLSRDRPATARGLACELVDLAAIRDHMRAGRMDMLLTIGALQWAHVRLPQRIDSL